jgi:hypothetical protein
VLAALVAQVRMAAQYAVRMPPSLRGLSEEQWAEGIAHLLDVHGDGYPVLRAAVAGGGFGPPDKDPLAFGLRCVLDGVAVRIDAHRRRRRARPH